MAQRSEGASRRGRPGHDQQAVVRVWRKPLAKAQATERDGQGQMRVYLEEMRKEAEAGKLDAVPLFAASMSVEGLPCGG